MSNAAINDNNNSSSHVSRVFRSADMTRAVNNSNNNNNISGSAISQPGSAPRDVNESMSLPQETNNNNYNYSIQSRNVEGKDALRGFVSRPDGM